MSVENLAQDWLTSNLFVRPCTRQLLLWFSMGLFAQGRASHLIFH